jgi:hypothetical protein
VLTSKHLSNCDSAGITLLANAKFLSACANTHTTDPFKEINMAIQAFRFIGASAVVLVATMFASSFACAQVSDGRDKPAAVTGLGETLPRTSNLSKDLEWQIYEFQRDGVRYLQINDNVSNTRAAIGQIGATAWVLPIGRDADRVVVQSNTSTAVAGRVVYRDNKIQVIHSRESNQDRWIIQPKE